MAFLFYLSVRFWAGATQSSDFFSPAGAILQQVLEFQAAERAAFAALSREGEVHPQPLDIQGQTACPVPSGSGLLQALDKVPAGDGGADQGNGA